VPYLEGKVPALLAPPISLQTGFPTGEWVLLLSSMAFNYSLILEGPDATKAPESIEASIPYPTNLTRKACSFHQPPSIDACTASVLN
jgi:hypothetical protein